MKECHGNTSVTTKKTNNKKTTTELLPDVEFLVLAQTLHPALLFFTILIFNNIFLFNTMIKPLTAKYTYNDFITSYDLLGLEPNLNFKNHTTV